MRSITITYQYDGDEDVWRTAINGFIAALNADPVTAGKFAYQVAVADDAKTRIHWGRWDNAETLAHVQSQAYFRAFAEKVREFSGGGPTATGADVVVRTDFW